MRFDLVGGGVNCADPAKRPRLHMIEQKYMYRPIRQYMFIVMLRSHCDGGKHVSQEEEKRLHLQLGCKVPQG